MDNNESDDAADRRQRLQALRSQHDQNPGKSSAGDARPARKFQGGRNSDADSTEDRKRQFVKNLIKKRMQQGGGEAAAGRGKTQKREKLAEAIKNKAGKAGATDKSLDKFPRLKAIIEQRRVRGGSADPEPVEKLEQRVARLEEAVKKTQDQLGGKVRQPANADVDPKDDDSNNS